MKRKLISAILASSIASSAALIPSIATAQTSQELMQQIQALQAQLKAIQEQVAKQAQATQQAQQSATQSAQKASAAATTATTAAATATKEAQNAKVTVTSTLDDLRLKFPKESNGYQPGTVNMYTGESNPNVADSQNFMQRERDDSLSFKMPNGGGITLYGNLDVSADVVTNGLNGAPNDGKNPRASGNNGWLPALSTNNTYLGLRGFQPVSDWHDTQFLWQLQGNIALTAQSSTVMTNSNQSNTVNGGLTTGTSYIGLGSKDWGAVKVGKSYGPYQLSTQALNPFQGMLGSYNVIMGNTGGDNRVEFGTLMEHSIWYESPTWNNMSFAALFSPGQNRDQYAGNISQGSGNCNGGNIPGSGGTTYPGNGTQYSCNDGGFTNAFSASLVYDDKKEWYALAAYELHQSVNRSSDIGGFGTGTTTTINGKTYTGDQINAMDTGSESAAKVGLMYHWDSTGTRLGGVYESMKRNISSVLAYQNERQRNGTWLVLMQDLPGSNQLNFGWGHAFNAVGDPGQHNNSLIVGNPSQTTNIRNSANMYTVAGIHQVDRNLSFYANYALTVNNTNAHYDLGAGGHGITTDCHDGGINSTSGVSANGGISGTPACYAGSKLQGVSIGMRYRF